MEFAVVGAAGLALVASMHIRRVPPRKLILSDFVFTKLLNLLARSLVEDGITDFSVVRVENAYRISCNAKGTKLVALVVLRGVRLHGGQVQVVVDTPQGIKLTSKPLVSFFAGAVASMFGGQGLGRQILSAGLPRGITWDGKRLNAVIDIPRSAPAEAYKVEASMIARVLPEGLELEVSEGSVDAVAKILTAAAVNKVKDIAVSGASAVVGGVRNMVSSFFGGRPAKADAY